MTQSKLQRAINIINKALSLGFDPSFTSLNHLDVQDLMVQAQEYLIENTEHTEDYCAVTSTGRSQNVYWNDGKGFEYQCDGEIIIWSNHRFAEPGTKIIHSTVVDSEANVVDLYDTVK